VIRHVVVGRLKPDVPEAAIRPVLEALARLRTPGLLAIRTGVDLRLKDGTWDLAITTDLEDEAAYRAYDTDPEHDRIRREGLLPLVAELARVQFTVLP
jgi:DNA-binding FadR family transcriptional regulator